MTGGDFSVATAGIEVWLHEVCSHLRPKLKLICFRYKTDVRVCEREPAPNFFPSIMDKSGGTESEYIGFFRPRCTSLLHIPRDVAAADGAGGCDAGDPGRRPSATR